MLQVIVFLFWHLLFYSPRESGAFSFQYRSTSTFKGLLFSPSRTALHATWSNGQAIQEYQAFLASGKSQLDQTPDGPSVILTDNTNIPLVLALTRLGMGDDVVKSVAYGDYPELPTSLGNGMSEYPIYVAISPSSLKGFLDNLSDEYKTRYDDFVFFSGGPHCGCIESVLKQKSLARDTITQVLVGGLLCPKDEFDPRKPQDLSVNIGTDSVGENKYAGECAACGKWQGSIRERFERNSIRCKTGFYREWRRLMWECAVYDAVMPLIGAVREESTNHAQVAMYYHEEASDMIWQLATALRGMLAVTMTYGAEERMYSFAEQREKEMNCVLPDANMYDYTALRIFESHCPMIADYLAYARNERGLLQDVQLPDKILQGGVEVSSIMRRGNLRADGVV